MLTCLRRVDQGDESERVETLTDSQIQVEVMTVLRAMYPNIVVPEPTSMLLHRWHSDPLYRGSWVNWPAGCVLIFPRHDLHSES